MDTHQTAKERQQREAEELDALLLKAGLDPKTTRFPAPPVYSGAWTPEDWCRYIVNCQPLKP